MEKREIELKLTKIYQSYNNTIKPLIADVEARYQKFPDSLFNEIRALHDHIARCYEPEGVDKVAEIRKAESHVLRITFDCYKYLDAWFHDFIDKFDDDFDISLIDNGEFSRKFYEVKIRATNTIREAKKLEGKDKQKSFDLYQESYNIYSELTETLEFYLPKIQWAKKLDKNKKRKKDRNAFALSFFSGLLSGLIIAVISYYLLK